MGKQTELNSTRQSPRAVNGAEVEIDRQDGLTEIELDLDGNKERRVSPHRGTEGLLQSETRISKVLEGIEIGQARDGSRDR